MFSLFVKVFKSTVATKEAKEVRTLQKVINYRCQAKVGSDPILRPRVEKKSFPF